MLVRNDVVATVSSAVLGTSCATVLLVPIIGAFVTLVTVASVVVPGAAVTVSDAGVPAVGVARSSATVTCGG